MPTFSTAAIVLAGGSSSRMGAGRHKLLLPLGNRPVIAHVVDAAIASQARPIIIVLGHQAAGVRAALAYAAITPELIFVENPAYQSGMSSSLRVGIQALQNFCAIRNPEQQSPEIDGALILLGDLPLITPQIINTLIETRRATGQPVVAPQYSGQRGHPMLFASSLFPELLDVTGDEGGRTVVARHRNAIATVELGDNQANFDVDTWEAYQQVLTLWQRQEA
jgi:molybdenum cofactor cytidylyltransferase